MPDTTTGLFGWNFKDQHVQPSISEQSYITSESQLIAFGPPNLSDLASAPAGTVPETDSRTIAVVPAGLVENFSVAQGQQVIKLYEIGSVRSYILGARADGQISLNRVLYNGESLMRMMYAAYKAKNGLFQALTGNSAPGVREIDVGTIAPGTVNAAGQSGHDFFFNMQNVLFRQQFGTLLFMKDQSGTPYSGMYFESCMIASHGFGTSSAGIVVQEAAGLRFDRMLPINVRFTL